MAFTGHLVRTAALSCCLAFAGCGGEPYTYVPDNELKPGPGLFSGEDGAFNIGAGQRRPEEPPLDRQDPAGPAEAQPPREP